MDEAMEEYIVIQVPGAAAGSHVSWIKTVKAHPLILHVQQHAELLLSLMAPNNGSLYHRQVYEGTYLKSTSKLRYLGKHPLGINLLAYF